MASKCGTKKMMRGGMVKMARGGMAKTKDMAGRAMKKKGADAKGRAMKGSK